MDDQNTIYAFTSMGTQSYIWYEASIILRHLTDFNIDLEEWAIFKQGHFD